MRRTAFTDLEWNGKPILELDHAELLQLCERLHDLVWASSENFERLLILARPSVQCAGNA